MTKGQLYPQDMAKAHVFISGRVQGVFFRHYTRQRAASLKVTGWVRNCYDGRVEAVFEGAKDAVVDMIQWCHQGPPSAVVDKVEVEWQQYRGEFDRFEVRY